MTHIFIGCNQIIGRRSVYFKRLSALEVHETAEGRVTQKGLSQWRTESPKGFTFSMRARLGVTHGLKPKQEAPDYLQGQPASQIGLLQDSDAVRAAWDKTLEDVKALSPRVLLLETPVDFTPTETNRARVAWFAKELAPMAGVPVAWQPHGLWDLEETIPWVRSLGLIPAYDPTTPDLEVEPSRGTGYFFFHHHRGLRANWTEFDMEELLESLMPYQRAFLFFRGPERYRDARLAWNTWQALQDAGIL
jgi:uncharacterized protein YecE (DUF72 family)